MARCKLLILLVCLTMMACGSEHSTYRQKAKNIKLTPAQTKHLLKLWDNFLGDVPWYN